MLKRVRLKRKLEKAVKSYLSEIKSKIINMTKIRDYYAK